MAILRVLKDGHEVSELGEVSYLLARRGITLERWPVAALPFGASSDDVLQAQARSLEPYMAQHGYSTADVVTLTAATPDYAELRAKFRREHTHAEDEVRIFLEGWGVFLFHLGAGAEDGEEVVAVRCERGELISVPAGVKHWFDCGEEPSLRAIRLFTSPNGWVPQYTGSEIGLKHSW